MSHCPQCPIVLETSSGVFRVCADELLGIFFFSFLFSEDKASTWTQIAAETFDLLDLSPV